MTVNKGVTRMTIVLTILMHAMVLNPNDPDLTHVDKCLGRATLTF